MTQPKQKRKANKCRMKNSGATRPKKASTVRKAAVHIGKHQLKAVSLFSGAGGMDIGVEKAGFTHLACVEFDHNAADTLRFNSERHRTRPLIVEADIRTVDPLALANPGIDLLHGGPPCQAFSLIGKRGSLGDERGMLLFEMIRFARALRPRALLLEQVKGVLSAPNEKGEPGGVFQRFVRQLEELGYCIKWS